MAEIDVAAELADAPVSRMHRTLGMLIAIMTLFDGYDTFNPAYVIHYVAGPWGLAPAQAGLLVSSGLVGFLIGAAAHGPLADRFGRRGTLIAGLWVVNVFTLATALFADSFTSYMLLRILTGLGLGTILPLATTYINELAPRRLKYTFSLWGVALGWSAGGAMAGLVGVFLTPLYGWQVLYWVGALSIPLTIVVQSMLPESPRFMLAHGRMDELRGLLARLRPDRAAAYANARLALPPVKLAGNPIAALLAGRYRRVSMTVWATAFISLFCVFGLTGWIPTVMMRRGETFAASFGFGALMQVMSFIGGLTLATLVDRRTERSTSLLGVWYALGGIGVLTLLFAGGHVANFACVAASGFFIIGGQHVLNNFTAGSYDTGMRASGVGMMLGVGRVGAILGPFVAGWLQGVTGTPDAMFWTIGCGALAGAAIIASLGRSRPAMLGAAAVLG